MVVCYMTYKYFLFLILIGLPFFIVGYSNEFNGCKKTLIRFLISCSILWIYMIAARFLINYIDVRFADSSAAQDVFDSGGAKIVFSIYFAWIPAFFISFMAWVILRLWKLIWARKIG